MYLYTTCQKLLITMTVDERNNNSLTNDSKHSHTDLYKINICKFASLL